MAILGAAKIRPHATQQQVQRLELRGGIGTGGGDVLGPRRPWRDMDRRFRRHDPRPGIDGAVRRVALVGEDVGALVGVAPAVVVERTGHGAPPGARGETQVVAVIGA